MGAVVGMAVIGLFGFLAFSLTIVGGIAGGVLGGTIGRYAGRKLTRKIKRKEPVNQEELYMTKIQCMIRLGELQQQFLINNLNKYRLSIEKVSSLITLEYLIMDQNYYKKQIYIVY